jgi:pilus assembly protein CpaF
MSIDHRVRSRALRVLDRPDLAVVAGWVRDEDPLLPLDEVDRVAARLLASIDGLGALEPLLAEPGLSEIMVIGDGRVWVERDGELTPTGDVLDVEARLLIIERIIGPLGLRVDRSQPLADARLPDGSRVHVVVPPVAVDGPCITIRRFGVTTRPLSAFADTETAANLVAAVQRRRNILVSGGTGSGKTSLLNALAAHIGARERIVTVEDAAELALPGEHIVRLETRTASAEGVGALRVRDLVRNALRMRPDRIIVGECRGGEALDMVQAMNTGHEGSLSTCHANGPGEALARIETMMLMSDVGLPLAAARAQLGSALDLVVHVARRPAGARRIVAVHEVLGPVSAGEPCTTRAAFKVVA